jgi:hypothetical protein
MTSGEHIRFIKAFWKGIRTQFFVYIHQISLVIKVLQDELGEQKHSISTVENKLHYVFSRCVWHVWHRIWHKVELCSEFPKPA